MTVIGDEDYLSSVGQARNKTAIVLSQQHAWNFFGVPGKREEK